MNAVFRTVLDLLFPPKCMLCHRVMDSSVQSVCDKCAAELPEYEGALRSVPRFHKCVAPFFYKEPICGAIIRLKFHGMQAYADQFGRWMAIWVRDNLAGEYDLISWVPCSGLRKWKRGFDQAELLAKALGRELDMPVLRTLRKIKNNSAQSRTTNASERKANVLGVYRPYRPQRFQGLRVLLVDDVVTTGSTLTECGKTLEMAGAGRLVCAAVAITAAEKDK